jgi:hypothetical protein
MKLAAQILIRLRTEIRERFSDEDSLAGMLKGLFIQRKARLHEETFAAQDILSRLNLAFKSCGITDLVRISHDDTEFYLDKNKLPHDLEQKIQEFNEMLHNAFERFYEQILIIMENTTNQIDYRIELELLRLHPVGEYPISIEIFGVPESASVLDVAQNFQLFVEKFEQNIYKYLDIASVKIIYQRGTDMETSYKLPSARAVDNKQPQKSACVFFPLYGITLGETSIGNLAKIGVKAKDLDAQNKAYKYYLVNDMRFWHNDRVASHIYLTYTSPLPKQWQNCGLSWSLSYNQWLDLFKNLGFSISIVKQPGIEWYNGKRTLAAEFYATIRIRPTIQLTVEVYFNYSKKTSVTSPGTIYSLRFLAN